MYAVYHGPKGLNYIAEKVHNGACTLAKALEQLGFIQLNTSFFDTIKVRVNDSE
jgi:glycine dehydrogenase